MGVYCIAAGSSSDNRLKTLDRPWSLSQLQSYLTAHDARTLENHFPSRDNLFLWGANRRGQLPQVKPEEYVIDFQDHRVPHIFQFCFFTFTASDTALQRHVGWDSDRPYPYVYFLKNPVRPFERDKKFFLDAFNVSKKPHFFDGQKYLDDIACSGALERTAFSSIEELLGLCPADPQPEPSVPSKEKVSTEVSSPTNKELTVLLPPIIDAETLISRVKSVRGQPERNMEDVVKDLLVRLGHPINSILFQRGRVDLLLQDGSGKTTIVFEVKRSTASQTERAQARRQAMDYACQTGAPMLVITDGDRYEIYDRARGRDFDSMFCGRFQLTQFTTNSSAVLDLLRPNRKQS